MVSVLNLVFRAFGILPMEVQKHLSPLFNNDHPGRMPKFLEIAGDVLLISAKGTAAEGSAELSCREVEILMFVANGLTNQQIGLRLDLSYHTVRAHLRRIFKKLSVRRRTEAVRRFFECT